MQYRLLKATLSSRGLVPWVPQMAPAIHQPPLLPRSRPATPYQQMVQPPPRTLGLGVTFDSSACNPAPTNSRDTEVHGRQFSRGRGDDGWPTSCSRGAQEGSSIRKTGNPKPQQEGGCPIGVSHNIPSASTHGKPLPQPGGTKKTSPGDPLRNLTNYRSAGWRKDLGHILRSYYCYNYPSHKEEEWNKLKTRFFDYLEQCQEEWKTIKEETPIQYMAYMEHHFQALTSIKL